LNVKFAPTTTIHGASLPYRSIQVGLSRHIIDQYVNEWTLEIRDYTPLARKIAALLKAGETSKAKDVLPRERVYPVSAAIAQRLGMAAPK